MELLPCDMHIDTKLGSIGGDPSARQDLETMIGGLEYRAVMDGIRN